ncbi:hypothetical protein [Aeromonas rivipollensis]|uniref:hypothetical protein n=1 Tax=Aeromonas rivipollensis TaxID=948519 RepID=UPI0013D02297|nr:hypothetical protein [Aeromonas rivipollensis]NEX82748.1 hypothetical protein [Aeromonas rivipollensis]
MFDMSKIFDFIPNTVQAFASFAPTQDNHRFNIIFDIMGLVAATSYSAIVLYGLMVAEIKGGKLILELLDRVDIAWISLCVLATVCWLTTLFKK